MRCFSRLKPKQAAGPAVPWPLLCRESPALILLLSRLRSHLLSAPMEVQQVDQLALLAISLCNLLLLPIPMRLEFFPGYWLGDIYSVIWGQKFGHFQIRTRETGE